MHLDPETDPNSNSEGIAAGVEDACRANRLEETTSRYPQENVP